MVYNALQLVREDSIYLQEDKPRAVLKRKTTPFEDRAIIRKSKKDPFKSSKEINKEFCAEIGLEISVRTIRRRLNEVKIFGRISRKNPHLSTGNVKKRKFFARLNIKKYIKKT